MDEILPRLFLGDFEDAERVTHDDCDCILSLCEKAPTIHVGIAHVHAPIPDEVFLERAVWAELLHALDDLLGTQGHRVLVHCRLGKSRAPTLVAAYLARHGSTLAQALVDIVSRRSIVAPHSETWRGVREYLSGGADEA